MSNNWDTYKLIVGKLNLFAILLFVFWLPLKPDYLPSILTFWIITWFIEANYKTRLQYFPVKMISIALFAFFFLHIFALLYSSNIDNGLFEVQKKISLVLFPLFLFGSNKRIKKESNLILKVFILGNLVASIYLLSDAFFSNIVVEESSWYIRYWYKNSMENYPFWQLINQSESVFSGSLLSNFIHPSYFSMYLLFSILLIVQFLRLNSIKRKYVKFFYVLTVFFFLFMIYLLQARAGFVSLFIVILLFAFFEIKKHKSIQIIIISSLFVSIALFFLIKSQQAEKVYTKISNLFSEDDKIEMVRQDARFETWYSSILVIKNNFWFGTSPGDLTDELEKVYIKNNFSKAQGNRLNSHNQFLETFAGLGIFGFIILVSVLISGLTYSYQKKDRLLFFLIIILSVNFIFESMLNRMAGILFMMFFLSYFIFLIAQKRDT